MHYKWLLVSNRSISGCMKPASRSIAGTSQVNTCLDKAVLAIKLALITVELRLC